MKRWLKRHDRQLIVGLGVLFIACGGYGISTATEEWRIVFYAVAITLWLMIILVASGAVTKFFKWWERD